MFDKRISFSETMNKFSTVAIETDSGQRNVWFNPNNVNFGEINKSIQKFKDEINEGKDAVITFFDSMNQCKDGLYFRVEHYKTGETRLLTYVEFKEEEKQTNGGYMVNCYGFDSCSRYEAQKRIQKLFDNVRTIVVFNQEIF